MVGPLIKEPIPRKAPGEWEPFFPKAIATHVFDRPTASSEVSFSEVLESRRSKLGGQVSLSEIADLLWFSIGARGFHDTGRASVPIQWSPTPSSGGLAGISVVLVSEDSPMQCLYDPIAHRLLELEVNSDEVARTNAKEVRAVVGSYSGCTLRMLADAQKYSVAYENPESLIYRDAGAITSTLCLCANWLGLTSCPLGFLGNDFIRQLGMPPDRFLAVGAVQIGSSHLLNEP